MSGDVDDQSNPDLGRQTDRADRTALFMRDLLERAGGGLTLDQASAALDGVTTEQLLADVAARRLLAVEVEGEPVIPAFQIRDRQVAPAMRDLLAATPTTSPWELLQFLVAGDEGLGRDQPFDLLHGDARDVGRLLRFAGTLEV